MSTSPALPVEQLTDIRRTLHRHPEVSGNEFKTADRIREYIRSFSPSIVMDSIGGTGIAAIYDSKAEGPVVMFRAELDALPIEEENNFEYRSVNKAVAHKCGHDGHMAILLGLAAHLQQRKPARGKVVLLFQPAEETGEGASAMMKDERFKALQPDYIFALHNLPGYPRHRIICRPGSFTASVNTIVIGLKGKTSHAAEPEHGINPAAAISAIIQLAIDMENRDERDEGFTLITPIHIKMGEKAYGTSAGEGELTFTIRAFDNDKRHAVSETFEHLVRKVAHDNQLRVDTRWEQSFSATGNDQGMVELIEQVTRSCGLTYEERPLPFKWGEDFGLFTSAYKGAMFGLGAGTSTPALHNPDYDFPDEIIPTGSRVFSAIADQLLT